MARGTGFDARVARIRKAHKKVKSLERKTSSAQRRLDAARKRLQALLGDTGAGSKGRRARRKGARKAKGGRGNKKKHVLSPAGRASISRAQKARWAKIRAAKAGAA